MAQEVVMPQMGESITEGTLIRWMKKPGDPVKRDEPLFEISTDKVDTEVPSPGEGILLEIKVREGETVPVSTVVCVLGSPGEAGAAAKAAPPPQAAPARPAAAPALQAKAPIPGTRPPAPAQPPPPPKAAEETDSALEEGALHRSSPLVRKIAQEHGVDISKVPGTGAGGRVTKKDILDFVTLRGTEGAEAFEGPEAGAPAEPAPAAETSPAGTSPAAEGWDESGVRIEPMTIMRSKIADHMVLSRRTSAHVTTVHELDVTEVARIREARKESFLRETGVKLTYLPFVLKAAVNALKEFPILNSSVVGKEIHYHRDVHLGLAVALEDGLIVPVIRNADEKSILGLARAIQDLAERARAKRLVPEEVQGGTFTVTNFGSYGSLFATPIINQPQVAILGIGSATKRPAILPGTEAIAVRTLMFLGLSFDHRVIDGATADRFMLKVREFLEKGPFPLS